jgi:hypothetical protein
MLSPIEMVGEENATESVTKSFVPEGFQIALSIIPNPESHVCPWEIGRILSISEEVITGVPVN